MSTTRNQFSLSGGASKKRLPAVRAACASKLLPLLLLLTLPAAVQAQFIYTTNNGTITITAYTGSGGVVIPATINGMPVTAIGEYAFSCNSSLGGVTIGNNVTSIEDWAFWDCLNLTSVTILSSVTTIGSNAFRSCTNLQGVTIGNSVTNIGSFAFLFCTSLSSVTIPSNVTSIGDWAFGDCTSLNGVYFIGNAPNIGPAAFDGDNSSTLYYLPGATGWGPAFGGRPTMLWPDYNYTARNGTVTITAYTGPGYGQCTVLAIPGYTAYTGSAGAVSIPSTINGLPVTGIGEFAFCGCSGLTSLTIPNTVTNIGWQAFENCSSLTSVTVPGGVTSIGDYAFIGCTNLTGAYFKGNAPILDTSYGSDAYLFGGDNNATVYYLPGTTWGATFGGRPTVLWNPQVQTSGASFGVRTNRFGFNITGTSNLVIVVEACSSVANPLWSPVGTNALTGGSSYFSDPQWTNYPARLYRLRSP